MKVREELYWQVPAILGFNGSKTAGGVIRDLGAVDSPAQEPELLLKVGAAGILQVQTSDEDKAGEHLPLTLMGRNNLHPSVCSPIGGPH